MLRALVLKIRTFDFGASEYQIRAGLTLRKGHLYKYKSLDPRSREHVIDILRDSKLYFPRPSQLNDPDEGKPQLFIGDISDAAYRPAVEAWVRRCLKHEAPPPTEVQIQTELARLTQSKLEEMVVKAGVAYRASVERRYRIFSLAGSPWNRHLWEHYADDFNGVCIELNLDSSFGPAYSVTYSDTPRRIDLTSVDDFEHLIQTVLVKSTRWSEELEARMIFGEPLGGDNHLVRSDDIHDGRR
jgi:hypothetical protein